MAHITTCSPNDFLGRWRITAALTPRRKVLGGPQMGQTRPGFNQAGSNLEISFLRAQKATSGRVKLHLSGRKVEKSESKHRRVSCVLARPARVPVVSLAT